MATSKPDLTRVWAATAPGANVVDPDVTTPGKVTTGWQAEVPSFEHFNFLQQWFTGGLAHANEQGIMIWDTNTTYPIDGNTKGSDGIIYRAVVEQSGNDPVGDSGVNWVDAQWGKEVFHDTVVLAKADLSLKVGMIVVLTDRANARFNVISGTGTANTFNVIAHGTLNISLDLRIDGGLDAKHFGITGDGTTDDDAAMVFLVATGLSFIISTGVYLIGGIKIETDKQSIAFVGSVVLRANANGVVLFWQTKSFSKHSGTFEVDVDGKTGVWGMLVGPENLTQTTILVQNNHNTMPGIIGDVGLDELTVLQAGPDVGGSDSGCWYNTFPHGRAQGTKREIWLRSPSNAGGSPCNRNNFFDYRTGSKGGVAPNTGVQIDAGDTNNFYACNFEGVNDGTSPNTTPTAVKILDTDPVSGASNNHNKFYGGACEVCTRDLEVDNIRTEFYGFTYDDSKSIFANPLITKLGGSDSSVVRQLAMGMEYTNVTGDSQLDSVKLLTGKLAFPPTQLPVADPNTLDDYIEGTFTVGISASTPGTPTFTEKGTYQKVGRRINFELEINLSALGGISGSNVVITGLPFAADTDADVPLSPVVVYYDHLTGGSAGEFHGVGQITPGETQIRLRTLNQDGQVGTSFVASRLTATSLFRVSGSYFTAD